MLFMDVDLSKKHDYATVQKIKKTVVNKTSLWSKM
jgi:hypothetical protein